MTVTVTDPAAHRSRCCGLLTPLDWPALRPDARPLHRLLVSMAELTDAVAAGHRLATELAAATVPGGQGWPAALAAIDAATITATDTAALVCQLTAHGMPQAADQLRRGLGHRLQATQLLRRTVPTGSPWPVVLDPSHVAGLLAQVIVELDQAGRALAAADHAIITAARKAHP